jgi:hypothetical protein
VSGLAILAHSGAASFQLLRQGSLFGDQQGSA